MQIRGENMHGFFLRISQGSPLLRAERGLLGFRGTQSHSAMNPKNEKPSPEERETVKKLEEEYMEEEALPEELAKVRASADVNRKAGRTENPVDTGPGTVTSGEDA